MQKNLPVKKSRSRQRGDFVKSTRLFVAVFAALIICGTGIAFADDPGPAAQPGPALAEVKAAINDPSLQAIEPPRADLQAAEELPHQDLSREQAIDLLDSVFGPALQSPAGIFDELDVEKFYSDNVALIAAGDQPSGGGEGPTNPRPTLLEASIPLRTEDADGQKKAVDLSLEGAEGEIQPANPLVEIGIPSQLGEKISLPEVGVEIALAGAPVERAPTTIDQSVAAYPSVAPGTTFVVSPAPTGLETLTLLQSAEAPTSQTFNLTLPGGATLIESADGGAEVRNQAGEPLVKVRPPSALDANEAPVPVHLETTGSSITVTAEPSEESTFPILVDPMWSPTPGTN